MKSRESNIFIVFQKFCADVFFFLKIMPVKKNFVVIIFFCILNLNECENYLARAGCTPIVKFDYGVSRLGYKNIVLICCYNVAHIITYLLAFY